MLARLRDFLTLDTWDRVDFDWRHYGPLRRSGLRHRDAVRRLEEMWAETHPHLDRHGRPRAA